MINAMVVFIQQLSLIKQRIKSKQTAALHTSSLSIGHLKHLALYFLLLD